MIGPGADAYLTGGGSSEIKPFSFTSPLEGIAKAAGKGVAVTGDDGTDVARASSARSRLRRGHRRPGLVLDRGRRPDLPDVRVPACLRRPGRADRGRGRSQPEDRGRDGKRRPGSDPVEQARGRRARAWYPGSEAGGRDGSGAVWQGRRFRPPAGHVPAQRGRTCRPRAIQTSIPGVGDVVDLRRGPARRLPPLRRKRDQAGVPVRPRPLVHELSLLGSARRPKRSMRSASRSRTRASAAASRSRSSTCRCRRIPASQSLQRRSPGSSASRSRPARSVESAFGSIGAPSRTGTPTATAGGSCPAAPGCSSGATHATHR